MLKVKKKGWPNVQPFDFTWCRRTESNRHFRKGRGILSPFFGLSFNFTKLQIIVRKLLTFKELALIIFVKGRKVKLFE